MQTHPVLGAVAVITGALKDVADVNPTFMSVADKAIALMEIGRVQARLKELQLRVLAAAGDVAIDQGARDVPAWLTHHARLDRGQARREQTLAMALDARWHQVAAGMREGVVTLEQAHVITQALERLPADLDPEMSAKAEARLVAEAERFGPRELRIMGRRILDVIAPELAEDHERRLLEAEETAAHDATWLTGRQRGDGTTDLRGRVPDAAWDRLTTYLHAFTSPRRPDNDSDANTWPAASSAGTPGDRRPYEMKLGAAFVSFLETIEPHRLPLHGGDATAVVVTTPLTTLQTGLGVGLIGDVPLSAAAVRRLACTAKIIPMVLGGKGEILDLGRARRLYSPPQRKAMAVRDKTCRAEGCSIPAAWCEAHHLGCPWSQGGRTDLADGVLLCGFHHHRAHDHRYDTTRQPDGRLRFHRRT